MPGFEPKVKVELDPPKDDPITLEELAKHDGSEASTSSPCSFSSPQEDPISSRAYLTASVVNFKTDDFLLPGRNEGYSTYVAIKVRISPTLLPTLRISLVICPGHRLRRQRKQSLPTRRLLSRYFATSFPLSPLPTNCFSVFAGKDASRALAQSSLKPEECRPDWEDLTDEQKKVLADWVTYFSKRYNVVGKVVGATNTGE